MSQLTVATGMPIRFTNNIVRRIAPRVVTMPSTTMFQIGNKTRIAWWVKNVTR